ncbi:PAR-6 beta [Intoshia linei]|uniref:PAR-6 beta n=1 Tax=Intoshia linei TaxID=1819745 RepID=A0A177BAW3_9BILA|nr:PAR-6 beta [Intoshia linei]
MKKYLQIKSKYLFEFRRRSILRSDINDFNYILVYVRSLHKIDKSVDVVILYRDPMSGEMLPINNPFNFELCLKNVGNDLLRIIIQKKENYQTSYIPKHKPNVLERLLNKPPSHYQFVMGDPTDFHMVSQMIDTDDVPVSCRRVRLIKRPDSKPLGFWIRGGPTLIQTSNGLIKSSGIYISRISQNGLAKSTGLLAERDQIIEVNGIDVKGKTIDQVTHMLVANAHNLIMTVRPVNQRNNIRTKAIQNTLPHRKDTSHNISDIQSTSLSLNELSVIGSRTMIDRGTSVKVYESVPEIFENTTNKLRDSNDPISEAHNEDNPSSSDENEAYSSDYLAPNDTEEDDDEDYVEDNIENYIDDNGDRIYRL